MNKLNVVIIDDERLILDNIKFILSQFSEIKSVTEFTNPLEALDYIEENTYVDLIFIDISMPILNGLEVAERIFYINTNIKIIFVTAYEKYVINSFGANTIDYILKPVTFSRMQKTLGKIEKLMTEENKKRDEEEKYEISSAIIKLVGMKNNQLYVIEPKDACYIMASERELLLYTKEDEYKLKYSMNYWESKLKNTGWLRCHRSYLVNVNCIKSIAPMFNSTYNIKLNGRREEIPVSRSYINEFKRALSL